MNTVTERDMQQVRLALKRQCRMHPEQKAATCPDCAAQAEEAYDAWLMMERRRAHIRYTRKGGTS